MQIEDSIDAVVEESLSPAAERTQALIEDVLGLLPLLVVALLVLLAFWQLGMFLGRRKFLTRKISRGSELVEELLRRVIPLVFVLLGLVLALNILDAVAVLSAVLGAAGVLGIAVGFAIRDTIENFISSVMLSVRQPFRAKDYVDIDGKQGFVVRLTSRATILMTADGVNLRIPNAQVFKAVITNYSRNAERRITFALGIDAEDDPLAAMDAGVAVLRGVPFVLSDPPAQSWVEEVGDSNIVLTFAAWIDQTKTDFFKAKSALIRDVKTRLEADGFTLPEPIYRLRIDQIPDDLKGTLTTAPGEPAREKKAERQRPRAAAYDTDVGPDETLQKKVEEDRRRTEAEDLLDPRAPTEFGDEGGKPSQP